MSRTSLGAGNARNVLTATSRLLIAGLAVTACAGVTSCTKPRNAAARAVNAPATSGGGPRPSSSVAAQSTFAVSGEPPSPPSSLSMSSAVTRSSATPAGSGGIAAISAMPAAPAAPASISVVVTYSAWNPADNQAEVVAYVQALEPGGGTCTVTMSHNGTTRSTSRPATPDVSTTQCGTLAIPGTQLSDGPWTTTVSFQSAGATGTSAPLTIAVSP